MSTDLHRKVRAEHLRRDAFVYVRQSTPHQILNNTESTRRQYALRDRAVALGWPLERIHTIDDDQGCTAAAGQRRDGFEQLVSAVALGQAGLLFGLEVSRLARNNAAWQRLLELCALSDCLIGDEDGLYDPKHFNDRLLLGLKGTCSEAELHVLTARLVGGRCSKARRGELGVPLPIGFVYDAARHVVLDPHPRVQESVRLFFDTFRETQSVRAVELRFRREGRQFPRQLRRRDGTREVIFGPLHCGRILELLANPRYAGAFVYGRTRLVHAPDARPKQVPVPRKDWQVLIPNAHPGYITFEEFDSNERLLQAGRARYSAANPRVPQPLLAGRVLCGRCGSRMQAIYDQRNGHLARERVRYYICPRTSPDRADPPCRRLAAPEIDAAVSAALLKALTPAALERALTIQERVARALERAEKARCRELEHARNRADLKRRHFLACDPDHRLVADALEADWNEALRRLDALQQQHERQRPTEQARLDREARARLASLVEDFHKLWNDSNPDIEARQHWLALLIEDVTLAQGDPTVVHLRWRGGRTSSLAVARRKRVLLAYQGSPAALQALDALLETCSDCEVARQLNAHGHRTWQGTRFTNNKVRELRLRHGLKSCRQRWLAKGYLTSAQVARQLGIAVSGVRRLAREGRLPCEHYDGGRGCVLAPLNGTVIVRERNGRFRLERPTRRRKGNTDNSRTQRR